MEIENRPHPKHNKKEQIEILIKKKESNKLGLIVLEREKLGQW